MNYLSLYLGSLIALIYSILVLPGKKNKAPLINPTIYPILYKGMIFISLNKDIALHIHHLLIFLIILLYVLYKKKNNRSINQPRNRGTNHIKSIRHPKNIIY